MSNYRPKCKNCYRTTNDYKKHICGVCRAKFRPIIKKELMKSCDNMVKRFPEEARIIKQFLNEEIK